MLGELTDELSGEATTQLVPTEPKSYSFNYGDYQQKSAVTLNHENNNLLNRDSLSKIIKKHIREITIANENKITRKNKEIVNEYCEKVLKLGYDKKVNKSVNEDCIDSVTNQSHDVTAQPQTQSSSWVRGSPVSL